jgi:Family of unknown function (DUF5652)
MELVNFPPMPLWVLWFTIAVAIWVTPWKAVALWKSASNQHLAWFVCIFIFNTLAILEIIYIFGFSRKK